MIVSQVSYILYFYPLCIIHGLFSPHLLFVFYLYLWLCLW